MFVVWSHIACVAALSLSGVAPLPGPIPAEVVEVIDADTIAVRAFIWPGHSVETRVRLAGVDAPETRRPDCEAERALGQEASRAVRDLLPPGRAVSLYEVELGSFAGRVVARLESGGEDLGAWLMARGLAQAYGRSDFCRGADTGSQD